jgi:hypothetical protein
MDQMEIRARAMHQMLCGISAKTAIKSDSLNYQEWKDGNNEIEEEEIKPKQVRK